MMLLDALEEFHVDVVECMPGFLLKVAYAYYHYSIICPSVDGYLQQKICVSFVQKKRQTAL